MTYHLELQQGSFFFSFFWKKKEKKTYSLKFRRVVPEMYTVPIDCVDEERKNPGSQERIPNGRIPFLWAQSLLILSDLLLHNLITPGEIDPLSRRLKHLKEKFILNFFSFSLLFCSKKKKKTVKIQSFKSFSFLKMKSYKQLYLNLV